MRITILAVGSRGDMQPMVVLARGLQKKGHEILFCTHEIYESFVTRHGLPFAPLAGNPQELIQSDEGVQRLLEAHRDPVGFIREMVKVGAKFIDGLKVDIQKACEETDAILFSPLAFLAMDVAERKNLPLVGVGLQPLTPTGKFQPMMLPLEFNPGYLINYGMHLIITRMFFRFTRKWVNTFRKELSLELYGFVGPFWKKFKKEELPVVYGYSPSLLPKPNDWPDYHHVSGFWFLDDKETYAPPAELLDFLRAGSKPIYIGFGSMSPRDPEATTKLIIEALEIADQRAVLLSGWAGLDADNLPDSIFKIDNIPHDWLFPKMAAVVHHGGAGTTAAGVRAGVPSIIAPFFSDQPFWGQQVKKLGIGPSPIPQKELTSERLAKAILEVVNNEEMTLRAREIGEKVSNENGVEDAISFIENHIRKQLN